MNEQIQIQARDRRFRYVDSFVIGVSTLKSVRGVVTAGGKTVARPVRATWPECDAQRRFIARPQGDGRAWLVKSFKPRGRRSGTKRSWATRSDSARIAPRLQPLRPDALSTELRPGQVGCEAGNLQVHRLHGRRRITRKSTLRSQSGDMATCQKNANGSPATGRSNGSSSRHGTEQLKKWAMNRYFVPPRDKTPCFSGLLRPATGHLYRFTICTEVFSGGNQNEKL